jgi:hypothetical protein
MGLKNFFSIIIAVILWIITIWIPYLNIGTTIAISIIPVMISRGEVFSPFEIFNSKYRRYMGEYFLVYSFMLLGVSLAFTFLIIPGIVLSIAWSLAIFLVIDKGENATAALTKSNNLTYGHKWTIFLASIVMSIIMMIAPGIVYLVNETLAIVVGVIAVLIIIPVQLGMQAYIYKALVLDAEKA